MKYLAAYLLLVKAGNATPSKDDVAKVVKAAGAEADDAQLDALLAAVKDKTAEDLIAEGNTKISSVASAAPAAASGDKEESKDEDGDDDDEEEEDDDDDMDVGMDLFG